MSEKLTRNFQTRTAGNLHTPENEAMMKSSRNGTFAKDFHVAADMTQVYELLDNQDTDGVLRLLAPVLEEKYKQTVAARSGSHTLTTAEKQQLATEIIDTMFRGNAPPPWFVTVVDIAVRLKADWDVPMPERSKGFDPAKSAGSDLDMMKRAQADPSKKIEKFVVMAQTTEAIEKLSDNLLRRNASGELPSLAQQVEELTKRVVALIKAKAGAPATPVAKSTPSPRFVTRRTGDVQEADLRQVATTEKRASGAFVPRGPRG